MRPDPEAVAQNIVDQFYVSQLGKPALSRAIADALRSSRDAALEEAAKITERFDMHDSGLVQEIAASVRALKSKDPS